MEAQKDRCFPHLNPLPLLFDKLKNREEWIERGVFIFNGGCRVEFFELLMIVGFLEKSRLEIRAEVSAQQGTVRKMALN